METIARGELYERLERDEVVVVEALPAKYFRKEHLPGAINVPPSDDFDKQIQLAVPDKEVPVVVYCSNAECPTSAKAAKRMETLGYRQVLRYQGGKSDWKEAGLPLES